MTDDVTTLLAKCDAAYAALRTPHYGAEEIHRRQLLILANAYPCLRDEIQALTDENKVFRAELTKRQEALEQTEAALGDANDRYIELEHARDKLEAQLDEAQAKAGEAEKQRAAMVKSCTDFLMSTCCDKHAGNDLSFNEFIAKTGGCGLCKADEYDQLQAKVEELHKELADIRKVHILVPLLSDKEAEQHPLAVLTTRVSEMVTECDKLRTQLDNVRVGLVCQMHEVPCGLGNPRAIYKPCGDCDNCKLYKETGA